MLDFSKPVWMYDDRSKNDIPYSLKEIIWQNMKFALCWFNTPGDQEPILINLDTGHVLNEEWDSYIVDNDIEFLKEKMVEKIIEWVPPSWCNVETAKNNLLSLDITEIIKHYTNVEDILFKQRKQ